jgi:hypothetical protein
MANPASTKSYDDPVQLLQKAIECIDEKPQAMYEHIVSMLLTQMTAAVGIRKHGEVAVNALLKEFCQLDDKSVFEPLDASALSREQKAAALRSISLIK